MTRYGTLLVALLLATPALAGCIGFTDDDQEPRPPDAPEPSNASQPGLEENRSDGDDNRTADNRSDGNATGNRTSDDNETGNASGSNATGNATSQGNETGNAFPGNGTQGPQDGAWYNETREGEIEGTSLAVSQPSKTETFQVVNGTRSLTLNLTVDGDGLDMEIRPPGCQESSCANETSTENGNATFTLEDPEDGNWTVELSPSGVGTTSSAYTLEIARLAGSEAG